MLAVTPEEDVVTPPKSPLPEGLGDANSSLLFMYYLSRQFASPNSIIAAAFFFSWPAHNRDAEYRDEL